MKSDESCLYLRQAQNYFIDWAQWLESEPEEFSELLSVANRLYPNLLTESLGVPKFPKYLNFIANAQTNKNAEIFWILNLPAHRKG